MNDKWTKWDYVCPYCDARVELTVQDNVKSVNETCPSCSNILALMSVVDATIYPITQKKEDEMNLTETPVQTMTLTWIENENESEKVYTENDVRSAIYNNKRYAEKMNEYYRKESQLRTLLEEVYADSDEQDTLSQIAEIFDVSLTKEIEVTVWIRVGATIEVDMAEGDYDIEDLVRNQISIDAYGSELNINDYEVERVEEGAY